MILEEHPRGQILLWIDGATDQTSEEVQEWLDEHRRLHVIHFPAYTPEENPKEATCKAMKEEVAHHHWYDSMAELRKALNDYDQRMKQHSVNFLAKFGYGWSDGRLYVVLG